MKTPQPHELLKAEKQVLTGVYVRLFKRYLVNFPEKKARALAGVVTHRIFCMEPADESMVEFLKEHEAIVGEEIRLLGQDREIRRIVSDTIVLKVVYMKRRRGCSDEAAADPVDRLKEMGIFLEGEKIPTPAGFIMSAKAFYDATPW